MGNELYESTDNSTIRKIISKTRQRLIRVLNHFLSTEQKAKLHIMWNNHRINKNKYTSEEQMILRLKDTHNGEACFIIGNGPSLKREDLEKIEESGYDTFASNKIYKLFPETKWRPTYYSCIDREVFFQNIDDILSQITCPIMLHYKMRNNVNEWIAKTGLSTSTIFYCNYHYCEGIELFRSQSAVIESGGTVTFTLLEWAWMMGYRTFYIIGCDHNYNSFSGKKVGTVVEADDSVSDDYFIKGYIKPGERINIGDLDKATRGYLTARQYIESNGGKIYNATRGGQLEVFDRIDIDDLLRERTDMKYEDSSICSD